MANGQGTPLRNRAGDFKSPYISAQADGPVAWQLLDDEAVSRAKAENKMVFLNIGYMACHYCRLMMSEAFANPQCASLLNESFVPIIVDREVRPDIDTIYMNYMQAVNGAGGWPMNLFLTPDLAPVFGGTYWPGPGTSHGAVEEGEEGLDFLVILQKLKKVWKDQEVRCRTEAKEVLTQLREFAAEGNLGNTARDSDFPAILTPPSAAIPFRGSGASASQSAASELDLDDLEKAYDHIARTFDPVAGGFGIMPKFPTPPKLSFLLRLSQLPTEVQDVVGEAECAHAREMTLFTLRKIRDRALRDHVGGEGMLRYSVNSDWSVPNFEKLVVDNALLLGLYLDAWLSAGAQPAGEFLDIVAELADYLSSPPICLPDGGFASSEAADSYYSTGEKVLRDGAYYLWTRREFDAAVGNGQEGTIAATYWNVLEHGNVEPSQDPHDAFMNRNVLHVTKDVADLGKQFKLPADVVRKVIKSAKSKLKKYRDEKRVRPEVDDKIIASWNGLVISALARTSMAVQHLGGDSGLNHKQYLDAAVKAASFIRENLWDSGEKVLYRIYRSGRGTTTGLAEDYAFMIEGLVDLYHATWDDAWLQWADELQQIQINLFYDAATTHATSQSTSGAFYSTSESSSQHAILRLKDGMDTSLPSTNGVSASNLFRLGIQFADSRYVALARETVNAFEIEAWHHPWLFPGLMPGIVALRLRGESWILMSSSEDEEGSGPKPNGDGGGVSEDQLLRALYTAPRGGVRGVVRAGGKDDWVVSRNPKLKAWFEDGGDKKGIGGVLCEDEKGYRALTTGDLSKFAG